VMFMVIVIAHLLVVVWGYWSGCSRVTVRTASRTKKKAAG